MVRTLPRFPSLALPTSPLPPRRNIPDRAGAPTPAAPPPLRLAAALPLTRLLPPPGRPRPPAGERRFGLPSRIPRAPPPPTEPRWLSASSLHRLGSARRARPFPSPVPSHLSPTRPSPRAGDSRPPRLFPRGAVRKGSPGSLGSAGAVPQLGGALPPPPVQQRCAGAVRAGKLKCT